MSALEALLASVKALPAGERAALERDALLATAAWRWVPNVGPQTEAYFCLADELLFGGEAGGGKSDLLVGLGLNDHERSLILRRVNKDVGDLGDRLVEILGTARGYNSQRHTYREPGRLIELAGCEHEKSKLRFKGRPHDLKGFDELADFLESQYLYIIGWTRSVKEGQRSRVVATTNGPTTPEAQWIVRRWAAWLDPSHPNPAKSGELRWYLRIENRDVEVDGPGPHAVEGRRAPVMAKSRTFIRSYLEDNPDLARTGYRATLEGLEEDVRRAVGEGDFTVGLKDDEYQVIPAAWIEAAMARWTPQPPKDVPMSAMAVDVAQGGKAETVVACRYDGWFAELECEPGEKTREGYQVAGMVVRRRRNACPVVVDAGGGYGTDTVKSLTENGIPCVAYLGVKPSTRRTRHSKIKFGNVRAQDYYALREELDPEQESGSVIALPDDPVLKADLAAVRRKPLTPRGLLLESKEDIVKRLGRSTDRGDAVVMCLAEGARAQERALRRRDAARAAGRAHVGYSHLKRAR